MKRLICAMLIAVFFVSFIPTFTLVAGSDLQPAKLRTVWQNPYTLTTYHPDDTVNSTFYMFPQVIWNGSQYVDYILNSSDMSAGIGSVYIKVCADHTVFYDPYPTEERVQSESWNVECYNASTLEWETDAPTDNNVCYSVNSSGIYFDRTTTLSSGATFDEWYWLRIGSELKISVILHPVQTGEYKLIWMLGGVSGAKAKWLTNEENISSQVVEDTSCSNVQFTDENGSKTLVDWSDAFFLNSTVQKWETRFQELSMERDVLDNRSQAMIVFANSSLHSGESVVLDPTIMTLGSTDAESGVIIMSGPIYPPSEPYVNTTGYYLGVGQWYFEGLYCIERSYLSFDTSAVPAMAYNMNVTLSLETESTYSTVDFAVQVMGGNQPVYDGNLTILDGTQPIYNETALSASCWGTGRVTTATCDIVNYTQYAYVNVTIPSNQINKTGSTQFELKSSRDGINQPNQDEAVWFYSGLVSGGEPELEVSYCLDTVTINGETWFHRNVSTNRVVIVLFGAYYSIQNQTFEWIRSVDLLDASTPEKGLGKIMFLDALVEKGFSVYTPSYDSDPNDYPYLSAYGSDSAWVQDLTMYLTCNQTYTQVYLFGFSGGAVVVGNEIQKDYASRFSAAVMNCAPVDWSLLSGQIFHSALTASKAKVATFFPENVNDTLFYSNEAEYNSTEPAALDKKWLDWMGWHGAFFDPNETALGSAGENSSVAVINWFNAYHPPTTPFTPVGSQTNAPNTSYSYSSGTVDPEGQNVSYKFNWGGGTSNNTGSCASGTNVTCSHAWSSPGSYNITVLAQDSQNSSCWSPPLTVNVLNATITGCSLNYSDASQNLTTLDVKAPLDYFVNVNFTWCAARTSSVTLLVEVLNPDGSLGWQQLNGPVRYNFLDPGPYALENIELWNYSSSPGTGTLRITLTSSGSDCAVPWNEPVNIVSNNHPPNSPSFNYPGTGHNGTQYGFTVNANDPDGDNINYTLNWGDGSGNTTLGWCASGTAETGYHTWRNAGNYTVTAYVFDPYGAWSSGSVQVTMTNSSGGGGGGCPYVYDWNGAGFVEDNNILPASQNGNGTDTKDYYLLQQTLVPVFSTKRNSVYSLQIGESESNIDYIDQVKLMAVDYSQGTSIAVTQDGKIFAYQNPAPPMSAVDNNGNNELTRINTMNGNVSDPSTYYQGNKSDWLLLDFGRVTGPTANLVLRDDRKCAECIDVQIPNATGGWQTVDVLNPRDFWSIEAVNMTAYLPANGDFTVRLFWTQTHNLDFVGLDTSAQAPSQVTSAPPTLAIHSTMGDVTRKLLYDDEQCVKLVNGQTITAWFTLPNQPQGTTRSFILYTDGYYYTITP